MNRSNGWAKQQQRLQQNIIIKNNKRSHVSTFLIFRVEWIAHFVEASTCRITIYDRIKRFFTDLSIWLWLGHCCFILAPYSLSPCFPLFMGKHSLPSLSSKYTHTHKHTPLHIHLYFFPYWIVCVDFSHSMSKYIYSATKWQNGRDRDRVRRIPAQTHTHTYTQSHLPR